MAPGSSDVLRMKPPLLATLIQAAAPLRFLYAETLA
jgi:hypothetical protein